MRGKPPESRAAASHFFDVFFPGTFAPDFRACDSPIAIACLRLFTFLPPKTVKLELDAQRAWNQLLTGLRNATPDSAQQVKTFAENLAKKYPNTPTADRADELAKAI